MAALLALNSAARADLEPVQGVNGLEEIEFSKLSQRDLNPLGEKALAIHPEQWKHAEGEHFIYHFTHGFVATPVSVEAEFYYRVIVKALEREQPPGDTKSHIYIFETPEDWAQFQQLGHLEKWTGGIHSGGSLFIVRDPRYKFTNNSLGHEIAHLIVHRFYSEGVPCWLDEGFAEYVSKTAQASYHRARGYRAHPRAAVFAPDELIPLSALLGFLRPPSDQVNVFYDESERLVRFLVASDKASFLTLFDALGKHQPFESAFLRTYAGRFATTASFEEQFRADASKNAAESDSG
ncbi:MAG: hypothetical protein M3Y86_12120 [Verrucomicrobiota bacterium]|nr:hypothetical protein [Verrucomicrobiota bacterium]